MQLDVNTELYPIRSGEKYFVAFATTLDLEGTHDIGYYNLGIRKSLTDKYEYMMHGEAIQVCSPRFGLLKLVRDGAKSFNNFLLD